MVNHRPSTLLLEKLFSMTLKYECMTFKIPKVLSNHIWSGRDTDLNI